MDTFFGGFPRIPSAALLLDKYVFEDQHRPANFLFEKFEKSQTSRE